MMTHQQVQAALTDWLTEFVADWDLDETIGATTRLNEDLCFSSVDLLHFLAVIDMKMSRKLPFEKLMLGPNGYRTELTVQELADFVHDNQAAVASQPQAL